MMPWLNRLITRGSPFGLTACMGSKSPPAVMICCTFTASIAAHPPMAAADSSINARAASGPDGAGEEQADNSIRRTKAITNINPSLNSKRCARTVSSSLQECSYTHDSLNPQSIYARFLCASCLCVFVLDKRPKPCDPSFSWPCSCSLVRVARKDLLTLRANSRNCACHSQSKSTKGREHRSLAKRPSIAWIRHGKILNLKSRVPFYRCAISSARSTQYLTVSNMKISSGSTEPHIREPANCVIACPHCG